VHDEPGGVVAAYDLTAVVDPVRRRLEDGVRMLDRREPAPVAEEAGAERVDGFVRDATDRRRVGDLGAGRGGDGEQREERRRG
jgi:hypothetical protein